ncbi:MAG: dipeptide ABC transporter ATP-binding protein [Alphaproteobacteria bacterium]
MSDLLEVRDLKVQFFVAGAPVTVVHGVSFRIRQGTTVALVGESGSGKSVIAQSIMRILPSAGRIVGGNILFADPDKPGNVVDLVRLAPESRAMRMIRGGRISIVFQEPMTSLSPLHTIGDQVSEALHLHRRVDRRTGWKLTAEMLRMVGFPDPAKALKCYPFELSGGLRQRAMIAMALVCRPALLIADEPTTALDVTIQAQILKLLTDLQGELEMTVLMITHDLGVVANLAQEVVVIYRGKVMEAAALDDIFRRPAHPYLKALLRAVPRFAMAPGERLVPVREVAIDHRALTARARPWPEDADKAGPLLSVRGLTKTFVIRKSGLLGAKAGSRHVAVEDVSFDIHRGECLGLVGESGSGKSTTGKLIMRALTPDSGEVLCNDRGRVIDVLALSGHELLAFRRRVQFMFQDPFGSLDPRMTVLDIIGEPLVIHRIGTQEERAERVKELMRLVGLDLRHLQRYPHCFSAGQRQRIGIARALALEPDLLICDEPVSALDVSIQAQVLNLLKDLQQELGLTYLFISHNLAVVDYMSGRIAVMCAGRLVEVAPRALLFRNPVHPYTKALLAAIPEPNPDRRLDLSALMAGRASDPAAWPPPFRVDGSTRTRLVDLGDGHFVRAEDSAAPESLSCAAS